MIGGSGSVRSAKRWDCPKRLVACLQVLGRVLDVVVVRQEVIPVLSFMMLNGFVVLLRCSLCRLFYVWPSSSCASRRLRLVPPMRVDTV